MYTYFLWAFSLHKWYTSSILHETRLEKNFGVRFPISIRSTSRYDSGVQFVFPRISEHADRAITYSASSYLPMSAAATRNSSSASWRNILRKHHFFCVHAPHARGNSLHSSDCGTHWATRSSTSPSIQTARKVPKYGVSYGATGMDEVLTLNPETVLEMVAQAGAGEATLLIFVSVHVYVWLEFGHLFAGLPWNWFLGLFLVDCPLYKLGTDLVVHRQSWKWDIVPFHPTPLHGNIQQSQSLHNKNIMVSHSPPQSLSSTSTDSDQRLYISERSSLLILPPHFLKAGKGGTLWDIAPVSGVRKLWTVLQKSVEMEMIGIGESRGEFNWGIVHGVSYGLAWKIKTEAKVAISWWGGTLGKCGNVKKGKAGLFRRKRLATLTMKSLYARSRNTKYHLGILGLLLNR